MRVNLPQLEKKAVKLALAQKWEEAIQVNQQVLEEYPENTNAKLRLGKAYLQTKEFNKAAKLFKEVLDKDPINKVAQKNYGLAKEKKFSSTNGTSNNKAIVKEPGTSTETKAEVSVKGKTVNSLPYGQSFDVKVLKTKISLSLDGENFAQIKDENVVRALNRKSAKNADTTASFIRGEDKVMDVLISTTVPIFKGDKQDIKPYMKKGTIDEPEIDVSDFQEDDE